MLVLFFNNPGIVLTGRKAVVWATQGSRSGLIENSSFVWPRVTHENIEKDWHIRKQYKTQACVIYHASSLGPRALLLPLLFVLHFLGLVRVSAAGLCRIIGERWIVKTCARETARELARGAEWPDRARGDIHNTPHLLLLFSVFFSSRTDREDVFPSRPPTMQRASLG